MYFKSLFRAGVDAEAAERIQSDNLLRNELIEKLNVLDNVSFFFSFLRPPPFFLKKKHFLIIGIKR